jgi:hypothetical protein
MTKVIELRPAHWLDGEPLITQYPDTLGAAEVTLEIGGRIVATRVVQDQASADDILREFHELMIADVRASGLLDDLMADVRE